MAAGLYAQTGTLTIDVKDITTNDATVVVTPSSDDFSYYWGLMNKTAFENNGGADKAIENRIKIWQSTADMYGDGTTWQEMMSYDMKKGPTDELASERFDKLAVGTDYVVYAFGMDAEGNVDAPLVTKDFKTLQGVASDNTFAVELLSVQPDDTQRMTVKMKVVPTNSDTYTACLVQKKYIEKYDFTPGSDSEKEFINAYLIANLKESNTYSGEQAISFSGQAPDTDYSFFVIGVDDSKAPSTALTKFDFKSERYPVNSFAIEVTDIIPMNAHVKITPTDPTMRYYVDIAPTYLVEEKGGVEVIPEQFIIEWWKYIASLYDDVEWTDLIEPQTLTGTLDSTIADLVAEGRLSTQYWNEEWTLYVVGFGLDGTVLTEPAVFDYESPAPQQSDMTFKFEPYAAELDPTSTSKLEIYQATIDIIPSRTDEEFMVNQTKTSTYESWINTPGYGLNEFIKSQWLPNAVPFTDAVRLELPGLERYDFDGNYRYYTLMVMGWNEGPTTEPAIYEYCYDELFSGVELNKEYTTYVTSEQGKISVYGRCDSVVVYSTSGQVVGVLRSAGTVNVPAGVYVVSYTVDGKTKTTKVLVK